MRKIIDAEVVDDDVGRRDKPMRDALKLETRVKLHPERPWLSVYPNGSVALPDGFLS